MDPFIPQGIPVVASNIHTQMAWHHKILHIKKFHSYFLTMSSHASWNAHPKPACCPSPERFLSSTKPVFDDVILTIPSSDLTDVRFVLFTHSAADLLGQLQHAYGRTPGLQATREAW